MFTKSSVLFSMLIITCSVFNTSYAMDDEQYRQSYPLHAAVEDGKQEVERLINRGCNVNGQDKDGDTPLSLACLLNNEPLVRLLLEHGAAASINLPTEDGHTPLNWAYYHNNEPIARLLLEHGAAASINLQNDDGETPLHCACNHENVTLARLLLEQGAVASINLQRISGDTPLSWARRHNNEPLRQLLEYWAARIEPARQEAATFIQALHPRLGENSPVNVLPREVARYICNFLPSPINQENR